MIHNKVTKCFNSNGARTTVLTVVPAEIADLMNVTKDSSLIWLYDDRAKEVIIRKQVGGLAPYYG